ncbi:hypothetical protein, partial [Bacillus velezensis]|uniref:hypothetical protein n=1 Tax=Bacillus velezensis TaxID=492670 RepID=UPI0039E59EE4
NIYHSIRVMVTQNFSFGVTHYTKLFLRIQFGRATCGAGGSLILAIASKVRATCRLSADPTFPPIRDRQKIGKTLAALAASNHMNK